MGGGVGSLKITRDKLQIFDKRHRQALYIFNGLVTEMCAWSRGVTEKKKSALWGYIFATHLVGDPRQGATIYHRKETTWSAYSEKFSFYEFVQLYIIWQIPFLEFLPALVLALLLFGPCGPCGARNVTWEQRRRSLLDRVRGPNRKHGCRKEPYFGIKFL